MSLALILPAISHIWIVSESALYWSDSDHRPKISLRQSLLTRITISPPVACRQARDTAPSVMFHEIRSSNVDCFNGGLKSCSHIMDPSPPECF